MVGASSRDIRLQDEVEVVVPARDLPIPSQDKLPDYKNFPEDGRISAEAFEELLQRPLPPNTKDEKGDYTLNTPIADMNDSFIGRQLERMVSKQVQGMVAEDPENPNALMMEAIVQEAPLRTLTMLGDPLNLEMAEGLLSMMNGKFFQGLVRLLKNL
jgi:hypothetical protein